MARTKEFDREEVLQKAIAVFWEKGFAGTSTDELVQAMGIGRQSLYDTFGDKRALFLEALHAYNTNSMASRLKKLRAGPTVLRAIERVLVEMAEEREKTRILGCMGVNAICELGGDADVRLATEAGAALMERSVIDLIDEGKARGEIDPTADSRAAARFLGATLNGMKVQAKAGASVDVLRDVAGFAVRSLRPG